MFETQPDQQLFAELYDANPQAIVWMRAIWNESGEAIIDFEYTYCNDEGLRYLNLTREQLPGLFVSNSPTLPEDRRVSILEELIDVYTTGKKTEAVGYNSNLKKYARYLRAKVRNGVMTVIQDTSNEHQIINQLEEQSRKLATQTQELQEQRSLMDNILKHSSNGISVSEAIRNEQGIVIDARTIMANDAAVRFTGLPLDIYLSKTAVELDPTIIESPYYHAYVKTLTTGEPGILQYFFPHTSRWLELSISKMDNDHVIHIFTDITPIKEVQLQLEKSVQELKRSNTNLEDFAHAASHDLKEPLRKIRTFIDRLKASLNTRISDTETHMMKRVEAAAERMQLLVDDLLEFSHVSQQPRQMESIDLNDKVQKVLADLELSIEEKQATVTIEPLPTIYGHRRQLQQLFHNLISNALKYSKTDTPPQISIRSKVVKGADVPSNIPVSQSDKYFHLIEVSDNGIGFEQQYAEQIFDMFQRLHGKMEYSGTGVGLAIARKVVENHNGFIWATSQPGIGSTFHVLLPA
ncbi:sensor histidine kinase [Flavisolibacter tropicus]|uniref:sensor histidine kinase n=1 Tax=Flavisolibacter tropicus TaxID=1492898 RepID=UPI000834E8D8|nr:PAS domain-containing sensor histidine kinase [Flavisolibacter tropicus]